jgi:undecaprenyl diphosphate synthase
VPELHKNRVRLCAIGRLEALPAGARKKLSEAIKATAQNKGLTLILALNYGGRQEIVDACNRALEAGHKKIDEKTLARYLYAPDCPEPDLLIRTSGEMRLSNFLLWECAYTEIYVTKTLWPDFRKPHLYEAIAEYQRRERRFGGV